MNRLYSVLGKIGNIKYQTKLTARQHTIIADEPEDLYGGDLGPAPGELLCMSLSACTIITLKMYAERKQWSTGEIKVTTTSEMKEDGTYFTRTIVFEENLDAEKKERLLMIANKCPVHKTLANPIFIDTKIDAV